MTGQPGAAAQMNAAMERLKKVLSEARTRGVRAITTQPLTAAQRNVRLDYMAVGKLLDMAADAHLDAGSGRDECKESDLLMFITARVDRLFKQAHTRERDQEAQAMTCVMEEDKS